MLTDLSKLIADTMSIYPEKRRTAQLKLELLACLSCTDEIQANTDASRGVGSERAEEMERNRRIVIHGSVRRVMEQYQDDEPLEAAAEPETVKPDQPAAESTPSADSQDTEEIKSGISTVSSILKRRQTDVD